jgi:hypothetical protein
MVKESTRKWIEAAIIFSSDSSASILCPECHIGHLSVSKDEPVWGDKIDRWIVCDHCGKYNTLLMENPR